MIKRTLLAAGILLAVGVNAQWCGTQTPEEQIMNDPGLTEEEKVSAIQEYRNTAETRFAYANKVSQQTQAEKEDDHYIIPAVFHIIHNFGAENISNETVDDIVTILNEDFNMMHPNLGDVFPEFEDRIADVGVEFRRATLDPDGNCTNGIVRHVVDDPYYATNSEGRQGIEDMKRAVHWPTDRYMNVYVVGSIDQEGGSRTLGYATFPRSFAFDTDGFVMVYEGAGDRSSSASNVATHEIGHYLGLPHTFGNCQAGDASCCSTDDGLSDTPLTQGHFSTCPSREGGAVTCGSLDNIRNFMDYSFCYANFTNGQKAVMRGTMADERALLASDANLVEVGADYDIGAGPQFLCEAMFETNTQQAVCPGTSINFYDFSYHTVTSWKWTFPGGTPSSSTAKDPVVVYNTPGVYDVTLEVSDGTNSQTITRQALVEVLDNGFLGEAYSEGFETIDLNNTDNLWINNINNDRTFQITEDAAYTGSRSIYINNRRIISGRVDEIITNTIDLSGAEDPELTFDYSFAAKRETNTDELEVYVSDDCGIIWKKRKSLDGTKLYTNDFVPSGDYTPTSQDQWKSTSVNISAFQKTGVRFKFVWNSGGGNNLYIDNILIQDAANPVGIKEEAKRRFRFGVYPNPSSDRSFAELQLDEAARVEIKLIDLVGKQVLNIRESGELPAGEHSFAFNTGDMKAGVYLVRTTVNDEVMTKKLIVR